jgi:hypothetical protein
MQTFPGEFLNVDLDLKSRADPAALVKAWRRRVLTTQHEKSGGRHWVRFNLMVQPKGPADAIKRYARLIKALPSPARRIWTGASKELDIGIQAGFERGASEWVLDASIVKALAALGTQLRITVYSPLLVLDERANTTERAKRARSRERPAFAPIGVRKPIIR